MSINYPENIHLLQNIVVYISDFLLKRLKQRPYFLQNILCWCRRFATHFLGKHHNCGFHLEIIWHFSCNCKRVNKHHSITRPATRNTLTVIFLLIIFIINVIISCHHPWICHCPSLCYRWIIGLSLEAVVLHQPFLVSEN